MSSRGKQISDWLRGRITAAGARGLTVGLSGGVDSAVVARLCQMAAPGRVVAAVMPCHSDPQDEADAYMVADHFAIPTIRIDLEPAYDRFVDALRTVESQLPSEQLADAEADVQRTDVKARVPLANVKPRLRMASLYFIANSMNYLVAGTGNRSELAIGYFTKYGDGGVDLLPLGNLLKSEVTALAEELEVPRTVIEKPPSAGLWLGQTDEDEMGFRYAELENYMIRGPEGVAPALALRLERMIRATEHKRSVPPTPE